MPSPQKVRVDRRVRVDGVPAGAVARVRKLPAVKQSLLRRAINDSCRGAYGSAFQRGRVARGHRRHASAIQGPSAAEGLAGQQGPSWGRAILRYRPQARSCVSPLALWGPFNAHRHREVAQGRMPRAMRTSHAPGQSHASTTDSLWHLQLLDVQVGPLAFGTPQRGGAARACLSQEYTLSCVPQVHHLLQPTAHP